MSEDVKFETQMYAPIKELFTSLGYEVRSEVEGCDVVAVKSDEIIVIEMKKAFNMTLLYQAMDRKSLTPKVYVAIPRAKGLRSKNYYLMLKILRGLGIGLIFVAVRGYCHADIILEPTDEGVRKNYRRLKQVKNEIDQRSMDRNVGGSTRKKIITAYREASVLALCHMECYETLKTSDIKKRGYIDKVRNALNSNVFGWFEKVGRGTYAMSSEGVRALYSEENKELVEYYRKEVSRDV